MCSKLHDTILWKTYQSKSPSINRSNWVKDVYDTATTWLKQIPSTFPNYTLHDEEHILNVMSAIAGILGDQIQNLSIGECELIILATALHDIGMVFDSSGKQKAIGNPKKCRDFLLKYAPNYIGSSFHEWPEHIQQDYLRSLHPFRLNEVLANEKWNFPNRPKDLVSLQTITTVCQSHGEEEAFLKNNHALDFQSTNDVDPRFCALLLRLGDILDFDGRRAPEILFSFTTNNPKSTKEFQKHLASNGFVYPKTPSDKQLPYSAECYEPWIEHNIRDYLNWVDQEFTVCNDVKVIAP